MARPARKDQGAEGIVVEPYRGFGARREIFLMGRVFRQPGGPAPAETGDLLASLRRLLRRGAPGQRVTARLAGAETSVTTDRDGYFRLHLRLEEALPEKLWHRVPLCVTLPSGLETEVTGEVFVPPTSARFVVISDIDDTVMLTGVAEKAKMFWRLFAKGARGRVAFPGVAALYRALHGDEKNPILYVSRAPWSLYSMLEAFFRIHRIPIGPILFLREWGISLKSPLPRRARDHKLELIRRMLDLYSELPFVLIGDSGQHDPEAYAQVVHEYSGRVLATYIRNVTEGDAQRIAAIEALAREVIDAGSSLLLAADSTAMAEHAAQIGLVSQAAVAEVAGERRAESARARRRTRVLRRRSRAETRRAVDTGELERSLTQSAESPDNTLVEPQEAAAPSNPKHRLHQ